MLRTMLVSLLGIIMLTTTAGAAMTTTESGLRYEDRVIGTGPEAVAGARVEVHYTGWLDGDGAKGRKFDSSLDRHQAFAFKLGAGQVIKGWDEGVAGMKAGGKRTLYIPASLGYGARGAGRGVIPPNSDLIFEVELLRVNGEAVVSGAAGDAAWGKF